MYVYTSKIFRKSWKRMLNFSFKKLVFVIDFKIKVLQKLKEFIK